MLRRIILYILIVAVQTMTLIPLSVSAYDDRDIELDNYVNDFIAFLDNNQLIDGEWYPTYK